VLGFAAAERSDSEAKGTALLAETLAHLGDEAAARVAIERAESLAEEAGNRRVELAVRMAAARVALRTGDTAGARERAAWVLETAPDNLRYELEAQLTMAGVLTAEGARTAARAMIMAVAERATEMGQVLLARRASAALTELGRE